MSMSQTSTLHTCPVCENWQVDYTMEAVRSYTTSLWPPADAWAAYVEIIEDVLLDHLLTCFGVPQ